MRACSTTTNQTEGSSGRWMKHVTYPSCTHMALNALHGHMNHIYCPILRICKNTGPSVPHNRYPQSQILNIYILPYKYLFTARCCCLIGQSSQRFLPLQPTWPSSCVTANPQKPGKHPSQFLPPNPCRQRQFRVTGSHSLVTEPNLLH